MRPDHQEPASPLLPNQILREPVGQHRTGRRDVDHIGAAVLLAQAIVGRARVEHQRTRGARRVGDRKNLGGGKIDDEKAHAVGEHVLQRGNRIFAGGELGVDDREGLIEESAGRVVVIHRHARAGDKVVRGRNIEDGDRLARVRFVDHADLDGERIRARRLDRRRQQTERRREKRAKRLQGSSSLREPGVSTGMASAKVFSSLRRKRVRRPRQQARHWPKRGGDAGAEEDKRHVFPSEWRAKRLRSRRRSDAMLRCATCEALRAADVREARGAPSPSSMGTRPSCSKRPTLDGSHATHCAHRIGRP